MSEHIQSYPDLHSASPTATAEAHERTPGVSHELDVFDFWLLAKVGGGLTATVALVFVLVWSSFAGLEKFNSLPPDNVSKLALEDASRPLNQRLDEVRQPHIEGIERESSLLVVRTKAVRTKASEERRLFTAEKIRVVIGKNDKARLYDLREGQRVTIIYYTPGGSGGGIDVVTAVVSPPESSGEKASEQEAPESLRRMEGEVVRIEPRGVAAAREWAEVQMERYGWVERNKEIVHIPIDKAMETVLKSNEFRTEANKKKSDGRTRLPSRSSSGRDLIGGKP